LTLLSRYCFPIDYTDPTFWRLSTPVVAPLMSAIFSLPAFFAIFLLIRTYRMTDDERKKVQLRWIFWGASLACGVSIVSEYVLPAVFHIKTELYLMFYAVLIFVIAIFVTIMKYRLLNIQSDYIFEKLFYNSSDGIIIINKNLRIVSINSRAREVLRDQKLDSGDKITDYIQDYVFETNYQQHEVSFRTDHGNRYLSVTQYPIDKAMQDSANLLFITDITLVKQAQQREMELLAEKSAIDPLTGFYSKQFFIERYYDGRQEMGGRRIALLFVDVDDFKSVNDRYGHMTGDQVLKATAECIRSVIRNDAEIFRFGGDEFVVILKNTEIKSAFLIAERIRNCVSGYDFSAYGVAGRLSVSLGLKEGSASMAESLMDADMAMYASKRRGKNTTTVFSNQTTEPSFHMKLSPDTRPGDGLNADAQ
jgi:diguanylate cyclase (GGDEF)-like protein